MQDGVEVTHQDKGDFDLFLDGLQLPEQQFKVHAVVQGLSRSRLDDGSVSQGVAEGNAYFDKIYATTLHREDDISRAVEGGSTGTEVEAKEFTVASVGEELVYLVHCFDGVNGGYGVNVQNGRENGEGK